MATMQEAWDTFRGGLGCVLRHWTALQLAVENNWGGGDSARKANALEDSLVEMFKTKKELYEDELENFLADYLDDNFSTLLEDNSPAEVATTLMKMFVQCGKFDYSLAHALREADALKKAKAGEVAMSESVKSSVAARGVHADFDASSSDDNMGDGASDEGGMDVESREGGAEARLDADGWETVPSKKSKGRRL